MAGAIVGKYVQPNPTTCKAGGMELKIEQMLEINGVSEPRAIDNGAPAGIAFICFVSSNNNLYPTTPPAWGPFTGAIWKD